jgi:hypothetical protein
MSGSGTGWTPPWPGSRTPGPGWSRCSTPSGSWPTTRSAAAEFPDPEHLGHRVALAHKQAVLARLGTLAQEADLRDPEALADQLLLLMDGAWVAARMFGPGNPSAQVAAAATTLIEAHSRPEPAEAG